MTTSPSPHTSAKSPSTSSAQPGSAWHRTSRRTSGDHRSASSPTPRTARRWHRSRPVPDWRRLVDHHLRVTHPRIDLTAAVRPLGELWHGTRGARENRPRVDELLLSVAAWGGRATIYYSWVSPRRRSFRDNGARAQMSPAQRRRQQSSRTQDELGAAECVSWLSLRECHTQNPQTRDLNHHVRDVH